ncbi:MAG: hypothetical protein FWC40_07840 [Proteobacteria bacterium]|nr:hypothetical protein [Pseudomonadota bacterium]
MKYKDRDGGGLDDLRLSSKTQKQNGEGEYGSAMGDTQQNIAALEHERAGTRAQRSVIGSTPKSALNGKEASALDEQIPRVMAIWMSADYKITEQLQQSILEVQPTCRSLMLVKNVVAMITKPSPSQRLCKNPG